MTNKVLDTALKLVQSNIYVYPLSSESKAPLKGSHGEKEATTDPKKVHQWFDEHPHYNLAVNLQRSSLAVIDADCHSGSPDGVRNLNHFLKNQHSPESLLTYQECTPHHGMHFFYRYSGQLTKLTKTRDGLVILPGVELLPVKAVTAPSHLIDFQEDFEGSYTPRSTMSLSNPNDVKQLPAWAIDLVKKAATQSKESNSHLGGSCGKKLWTGELIDEIYQGTATGNRHNWMCMIIGKILHSGANTEPAYDMALFANQHCDVPLPTEEVESIFTSLVKLSLIHI